MKHNNHLFTLPLLMLAILSGCDRSEIVTDTNVPLDTPDKFLQFINPKVSLPAGDYTVVAATAVAGQIDTFTVTVTYDDASVETFSGNWTNSGGMDSTSPDNRSFPITISKAGGVKLNLTSTADNYLYLLDRSNKIVAENDNEDLASSNALIYLPASKINNADWANAYYAAIDPTNERDTLAKWKTKNGFDQGADVSAIFRDTLDLGYGRRMFARRNANGCVAIYVENFFVDIVEGLDYNTLNLIAAVNNDHTHHFGTNAVEFSDLDGDCDGTEPMFNKFYTFATNQDNHEDETRLTKVDLDQRGELYMPGPCVTCHGGKSIPLMADGTFAAAVLPGTPYPSEDPIKRKGDTNSKLLALDLDAFEFSDQPGLSKTEQLSALRELNDLIYSTYPVNEPQGKWYDQFARDTVNGWYNGDVTDAGNTSFDGSFVPDGWLPDPDTGIPAGSDQLFVKVIKPFCFSCHSKLGVAGLGTNADIAPGESSDIDLSSYKKFISYKEETIHTVYQRGNMPMSLLNYDNFWASDAPEILASFLTNFTPETTNGKINQPGKPIANAGLDRTSTSPVTLNAHASLFSDSYSWSIISTPSPSSVASLGSSSNARTELTADTDGSYTLQLISSNSVSGEQSEADTVTITIDSNMNPAPKDITFDTHIKPMLACVNCHSFDAPINFSYVPGVSVFFNTDSDYSDVINLINFAEPGLSLLLTKPAGQHHFGGVSPGFDLDGDHSSYDLFVNWVLEGAREN